MKINEHMINAMVIGLLCGIWYALSLFIRIPAWIFFAGCTSYFIAGGGKTGAVKAFLGNMSGLLWAGSAIWFSTIIPGYPAAIIATGLISGLMAYQAKYNLLNVTTTAFLGCTVTFASGNYSNVAIGLFLGIVLGALCDGLSRLLVSWIHVPKLEEPIPQNQ